MTPFNRILVPTDFSTASDAALVYAKTLAARFGSSVHLLHVIERPAVPGPYGLEGYVPDTASAQRIARQDSEARLRARVTAQEREPFKVTSDVLEGSPVAAIVQYASDHNVDLIVMGTHGRTGLVHVLLGSVAERTIRTAPCPVLTVRAGAVPQEVIAELSDVAAAPVAVA